MWDRTKYVNIIQICNVLHVKVQNRKINANLKGVTMKRTIAFSTLLLMLSSALLYPVAAQEQVTEVQRAEADARRDVSQDVSPISWGIGGFFCGVCAVAYVYIDKPTIPASRFVGKSMEYTAVYTETYQQVAKKERLQSSMIGCLAGSIFSTLTYYLSSQSE